MATLVLTAVGTVFGGTAALLAGGVMGAVGLLGSGRSREGPRLNDLAVQSSAYGTPLARLYGRMRAAGSVIWATDIQETAHKSGGGKGRPKTTTYSYSVSFAVALSARRIRDIGRIWADGKLIRSAGGQWLVPAVMRVYRGYGDEPVDPLIASVEGAGKAPAYRGMAYVVFENFDLSEFANHIPSLSFEVIADDEDVTPDIVIDDLCQKIGFLPSRVAPAINHMKGFGIASAGSIASIIESLTVFEKPFIVSESMGEPYLEMGRQSPPAEISPDHAGAVVGDAPAVPDRRMERASTDDMRAELSMAYYDADRDYQPGLQRAVSALGGKVERTELPAALSAVEAKSIAERRLSRIRMRAASMTMRLPFTYVALRPGDTVRLHGEETVWQIRDMAIEHMVIELALDRLVAAPLLKRPAESGRSVRQAVAAVGETLLHGMDLPPLFDEMPQMPRLWIATAGSEEGWRKADITMSVDEGASWQSLFAANGASVIGIAQNVPGYASSALWDDRHFVDVELAHDGMWLEGRSDISLLAGANMALLGDEIIQFGAVENLSRRHFRLSHLLRGRRGTEWACTTHQEKERFILLDPALMGGVDLPVSRIGADVRLRGTLAGQDPAVGSEASVRIVANALLPPSPVHVRGHRSVNGDIHVHWIRRSRQGWGWHDGVDAPLAEERELYRLTISAETEATQSIECLTPSYVYTQAEQLAAGHSGPVTFSIAQLSAVAGAGREALITIH